MRVKSLNDAEGSLHASRPPKSSWVRDNNRDNDNPTC